MEPEEAAEEALAPVPVPTASELRGTGPNLGPSGDYTPDPGSGLLEMDRFEKPI